MLDPGKIRLCALAFAIIFASTLAVLLARQFNLGPDRPAPDFRAFGPADAPVQIYEYTDFACPACAHAAGKVEEMMKVFGPGLRVHFKHFPLLEIHPWSLHAAVYADCAGAQGRFKDYAALLFENQRQWAGAAAEPREFAQYAEKLGLDWKAMQACSTDPEVQRAVKLDIAEGDLKGVNATPTFFVNGKRAVGSAQLIDQAQKFDSILREAAKK